MYAYFIKVPESVKMTFSLFFGEYSLHKSADNGKKFTRVIS